MLQRNPFSRPFPERLFGRQVVVGHARTAGFVLVALLFIFPVGKAVLYAAAIFAFAVLYSYVTELLGVRRSGPRWTMANWTLDQGILLLLVSGLCFLLYNYSRGWSVMELEVFLYIALPTVLVGLLPIVVSGIAVQLRAEQENQKVASRVQLSVIGSQSGGSVPGARSDEGSPDSIVAGHQPRTRAATTIYYRSGRSQTIDQPLEVIEKEYAYDGLQRCHPRYSVNPDHIVSVTADAQGLRLTVAGAPVRVPVTARYFASL